MTLENNCWVLPLCFVSVKLDIIIFDQAHLHSRTDSRAVRTEYCIVDIPHNTAI